MLKRGQEIIQSADDLRYPEGFNPTWAYIQPLKDQHHHYLPDHYSKEELSYWKFSVHDIDQDLVELAHGRLDGKWPEFHVHPVATPEQTGEVIQGLGSAIRDILNTSTYAYVGFAHGIKPQLEQLLSDPMLRHPAANRITTAIVGGTEKDKVEETRVLSPIAPWVYRSPIILGHDDVADKMAAYAAFTEEISRVKQNRPYNHTFVRFFTDDTLTNYDKTILYSDLIHRMEEAGVVAAFSFSKNELFAELLERSIRPDGIRYSRNDHWREAQSKVFPHHLQFSPKNWLFGEGLDTAIDVNTTFTMLPTELRNDPDVLQFFKHTSMSKVRYSWTMPGLYAMDQFPEDPDRAYRDYVAWTTAHHARNFQRLIQQN